MYLATTIIILIKFKEKLRVYFIIVNNHKIKVTEVAFFFIKSTCDNYTVNVKKFVKFYNFMGVDGIDFFYIICFFIIPTPTMRQLHNMQTVCDNPNILVSQFCATIRLYTKSPIIFDWAAL